MHTGEQPFACQVCDKKFALKFTLVRHQVTHTREKSFACQICDKKFAQKSTLVQHQATHTDVKNCKCFIFQIVDFLKLKRT